MCRSVGKSLASLLLVFPVPALAQSDAAIPQSDWWSPGDGRVFGELVAYPNATDGEFDI